RMPCEDLERIALGGREMSASHHRRRRDGDALALELAPHLRGCVRAREPHRDGAASVGGEERIASAREREVGCDLRRASIGGGGHEREEGKGREPARHDGGMTDTVARDKVPIGPY